MLPEEIEVHRDRMWRRDPENRVEDVYAAERFIEDVGFCEALTIRAGLGHRFTLPFVGAGTRTCRAMQKDPRAVWPGPSRTK